MTVLERAAGVAFAGSAALAIAWASVAPMRLYESPDAVVRVSLGARPERIETCRVVSDEELERLQPQMRQRVVCEGTTARYRLEVRRGGVLLASQEVRGGGLRHDRQLYVFRELTVPTGRSSLDVRFVRLDSAPAAREAGQGAGQKEVESEDDDLDSRVRGSSVPGRARREAEESRRRRAEAIPALLRLETNVTLSPREVVLVTYDADERRLVAVRGKP